MCSLAATCERTQTRAVACVCGLPNGSTATLSDNVCDSEDPRMRYQTLPPCGIECPVTTELPVQLNVRARTPEAMRYDITQSLIDHS